tara:strand:+ start:105 stop:566 length:462 start_codon:yes stop_codon:yes gene_type:complete
MKKIILVFLLLIGFNAYGNEKECLAENVYFEARGQGAAGWVAVAQVTLNRVQDKRFPNTICEVVKQGLTYENGYPIKNKCQFSWYCDGKSDKIKNIIVYNKIVELMNYILDQGLFDFTDGATHYHADYVRPDWAKTKTKTIEIEDHIFYRWEK